MSSTLSTSLQLQLPKLSVVAVCDEMTRSDRDNSRHDCPRRTPPMIAAGGQLISQLCIESSNRTDSGVKRRRVIDDVYTASISCAFDSTRP